MYLVSGDDTLLVTEACDQIVAAAKQQGFTERSVHHVETGFSWHGLSQDAASMSLFAERKILDVRVASKKLDKEASALLRVGRRRFEQPRHRAVVAHRPTAT